MRQLEGMSPEMRLLQADLRAHPFQLSPSMQTELKSAEHMFSSFLHSHFLNYQEPNGCEAVRGDEL